MSFEKNPSSNYVQRCFETGNYRNCCRSLNDTDLSWAYRWLTKKRTNLALAVRHLDIKFDSTPHLAKIEKYDSFLKFVRSELTNRGLAKFALAV